MPAAVHTTPPETLPSGSGPSQPSPSSSPTYSADLADALAQVAEAKGAIRAWEETLAERLAALDRLVQADQEAKFTVPGWSIYRLPGKTTYTYPATVKAIAERLKQEQELAVALGTATPKVGAPFWTVKEIKE